MDNKKAILSGRICSAMTFAQRVYAVTARIPRGKVATYRQVAETVGCRGYQAVGMALNRNPYAPQVPCHRVVGSDGRLVGFAGGLAAKQRLLAAEGVVIANGSIDLARFGYDPASHA